MNLVLICLDTFRADCLGALGRNDRIQTPHLDELARRGVVFEKAFGEGQPTIEFRRALITGRRSFPWRYDFDTRGLWPNGRGWHKVVPEHDTLAELLLHRGYTTGFFSDTYHMFKPTQNFTRGFTSWEFIRGQETDNLRSGPADVVDLRQFVPPGLPADPREHPILFQYLLNTQDRTTEDDWTSARTFALADRFLRDNRGNQPFFLWVDSFDPHEPWDPPTRYADAYDPDWTETWEPIHGCWRHLDERGRERAKALYYGECSFVDELTGRLLGTLDELGLADDTLVVVTSDHGTELWDHGAVQKGRHGCRYRHNNEILLLVRFPRDEHAGLRIPAFAQNHDILPTVLAVMGLEWAPLNEPAKPSGLPPAAAGENLLPLVMGGRDSVRDAVITGWGPRANVRTHEYSYSVDYESDQLDEHLFDVRNDPAETNNVAAEHADVCAEYRAMLEDHLGQTLPATPQDRLYVTEAPCIAWVQSAPRFRKEEDA
jgi:arylsulfatase A-like enzyme